MREADFRFVAVVGDLEGDIGARPLGPVFGEAEVVVKDEPAEASPRNRINNLDPATMNVLVPIDELLIGFVGATFDLF